MIRNLAYVGFASPAADEWRWFGPEVLGAEVVPDGLDGSVRLRVDESPWGLAIAPGDRNELRFLGWEVGDDVGAALAALEGDGLEVHAGDDELVADREADAVHWFVDHVGLRHELVAGRATGAEFRPGRPMDGGFVTGEQGLGHVVLLVPDLDEGHRFATEVLGLRLSDTIHQGNEIRFYHCAGRAARHHTLALSAAPGHVGIHHLMLEVAEPDDVGRAYDLARDRGLTFAMDLGRHPNDGMTSFYVRTPSGFEIEYGSGGVVVDDETWQTTTYDRMSTWGHRPPGDGPLRPGVIRRIQTGASA